MAYSLKSKRHQSPDGARPNMSDLRIVLVGKNTSENNKVGNLILNKNAFDKKKFPPDVEKHSGNVEGRNITVISTNHLLGLEISRAKYAGKVLEVTPSEPYVIILVLQHNDFSEKKRCNLSAVLSCFGKEAMKRTMILTTDDKKRKPKNKHIQQISTECGGGWLQFQNTTISQILKKVNELITCSEFKESQHGSSLYQVNMPNVISRSEKQKLNLALCGCNEEITKSMSKLFLVKNTPISAQSRSECVRSDVELHGRLVSLVELSGLNQLSEEEVVNKTVINCVSLCDPGVDVFLIVVNAPLNKQERAGIEKIQKIIDSCEHFVVLFTCHSKTDFVTSSPESQWLISQCGGQYRVMELKEPKNSRQIPELLEYIENMKTEPYSLQMYVKANENRARRETIEELKKKENEKQKLQSELSANVYGKQKLNLVLCGSNATLKRSVSKLLSGKKIEMPHQRGSSEVHVMEEELYGRLISLVELPALNQLSEEEVMNQSLRCVSLCDPGVHVFLLVINDGLLTDEDKAEKEKIQKIFESREHIMLLFTTELIAKGFATDFVPLGLESQWLIKQCEGQYRVMGLNEHENSRQIPELLDCIEKMKTKPYSLQMYVKAQENRAIHNLEEQYKEKLKKMENKIKELEEKIQFKGAEGEADDLNCLRIVLIGKTGNGKSATGNTILGRNEFVSESSTDSVTTVCQKRVSEIDGRSVTVVDTPGLFDTTLSNEQAVEEIVKCVSLSSPGPHVFVIVLSVGRFTKEENDTVDLIKKIFGYKAAQFSIVLFTRGDDLNSKSIEDYVQNSKSAELQKLIRDCGNRFLVFNNRNLQDKTQVFQLLNMIESVRNTNEGRYFTNSMFEDAEMSIKKRMEQILKERERELQAQNEKLRVKYETEMEELKRRLEEEKRKADEERIQRENEFRQKEEKLIKDFQEKHKIEQQKQELENQKQLQEEEQKKAEYQEKIKEMKREIENQRSQHEKHRKETEDEDRKRKEKYRQDQEKMKHEHECAIGELKKKQDEEIKKRDLEEKKRTEQEEKERREWERKIKEAENERKEIREEIKQQQKEWEDGQKRQMRDREDYERKRKEKHEEQMREKQEELEKMRERFEREREKEREKIENEIQKQKREREEEEQKYKEKKHEMERHYEQLEQERKEKWKKKEQEDKERQNEERKEWNKKIEELKKEKEEEIQRREDKEKKRKEQEEIDRDTMKKEYEVQIKVLMTTHENEARKQAEELNNFKETKEQHVQELKHRLDERQKQQELLEKVNQYLQDQNEILRIKNLQEQKEKEKLKDQKEQEMKKQQDQKQKEIDELKDQKEKELQKLKDHEQEMKKQQDQKQKEIDELKDQKEQETQKLKDHEQEMKKQQDQKQKEIDELKNQKEKETQKLKDHEQEMKKQQDQKQKEIDELKKLKEKKLKELQCENENLQKEIKKLRSGRCGFM